MPFRLKPALAGVQTAILPFCLGQRRCQRRTAIMACHEPCSLDPDWCGLQLDERNPPD